MKKALVVMGLALSLPSTLLGLFWLTRVLIQKNLISEKLGLVLFVLVGLNFLYLMVRYVAKSRK